jgi:hypothetical protein
MLGKWMIFTVGACLVLGSAVAEPAPELPAGINVSCLDGNPFRAALKPVPETAVFKMDGWSLWDPSVIQVGDTWHLFCSRWDPAEWNNWKTSHIIRATSKSLFGPYTFQEVVKMPADHPWAKQGLHNPKAMKVGDRYMIYHLGLPGWSTGFMYADTIEGPWEPLPEPVLQANNPALLPRADGSAYVVSKFKVKSEEEKRELVYMRAHEATALQGPYETVADEGNRLPGGFELEDPSIWWANNRYNVLCTDWKGKVTGTMKALLLYTSQDGVDYELYSPIPIWTRDESVPMAGGGSMEVDRLERPQVHLDKTGAVDALLVSAVLPEREKTGVIIIRPVDRFVPRNK